MGGPSYPTPAEDSAPDGKRLHASVLFADLSGFTAASERLDPETATELINRYFAELEAIVLANGGVVDKYIGDCVMAVFASDGKVPAALQAARAALAMRGAVREMNRQGGAAPALDVHVGIGTGEVIATRLGSDPARGATVVGDVVSLAQRIGEVSGRGQIYVDEQTQRATETEFEYRPLPAIEMKDLREPVTPYELCDVRKGSRAIKRDSERRQATILFGEVGGLEGLAGSVTSEHFAGLLNRCMVALEAPVHRYGGVVDKHFGASIMALFGVPNAIEDAPKQAINAAVEMHHLLTEFSVEQGLAGRIWLRLGINTGLVIAGEIGGRARRDFTVIGDVVNVAARLREVAQPGKTYVGPETYRYTRDAFDFAALPPLSLKGKERALAAYEVLSRREHLHRGPHPSAVSERGISSEIVGREGELAGMQAAVRRLVGGQGGIIGVVGDAGIGKSRLMAELLSMVQPEKVRILEGRSLSIGQGLSFHPFVDLLRRWSGINEEDDGREAVAKLASAVRELLPEAFDDVLPFVARLMGLRPSADQAERLAGLEGEAIEEMIFKSIRELLQCLAETRPLMLVFEDLHWADGSSIKLLESLLRLVVTHRISFVVVGRTDFPETIGRILETARGDHEGQLTELRLARLTDQQSDALIQNLLNSDEVPYPTRALIARKAEGNPFYIEEVIRALIDAGALESRDGRLRLTEKIGSVVIPGTIQEVILSRVDRLGDSTRRVLQVASVIGRSFYHRVLADVMADSVDLDDELALLTSKQLILERRSRHTGSVRRSALHAEREYVFKHALAQEAVYGSLLQRTGKDLHQRVARSIEGVFADRIVDFYGMLAYHYSRADDLAKAEEYLFKAGEEAARSAASSEALSFFREASRLYLALHGDGGDPRKKALLEKNIALALLNTGALTESIEHFDDALEFLGHRVPRSTLARWTAFLRSFALVLRQLYVWQGRRRRVADWERERLVWEILFNRGRAEITSDPERLFFDTVTGFTRLNQIDATRIEQASAICASCGAVFSYSGISFAVARKALAAAKRLIRPGNVKDEFTCASMEWILHYLEGDWDPRWVIDRDRVEEALRHGQLWDGNTYIGLYADQLLRQGRFGEARELIDQLRDINVTYGYGFAATNHDAMITLLLLEERKLPEALEAAEAYQSARHEDPLKVLGLGSKAKAQVLLGDLGGAAASLAAAEKVAGRSRQVPPWHLSAYAAARLRHDVTAFEMHGRGERGGGARGRALRSARYAAGIAAKVSIQRPEIYRLIGRLHWLLRSRRRALAWWGKSVAVGEHLGARSEVARTYALVGYSFLKGGGGETMSGLDGTAYLQKAEGMFAELALAWDLEQLQREEWVRAA